MYKRLFILLSIIILISCTTNNEHLHPHKSQNNQKLTVKVDQRMELLAVVQHFTPWAELRHTTLQFQYIDDINNYFLPYKNHEAVIFSQELIDSGFSFDAPPNFILHHDYLRDFNQRTSYSDYLKSRIKHVNKLITFNTLLKDFAEKTNFIDFYNNHKAFYKEIENDITNLVIDNDYITLIEDYYGESKDSYHIIPTPLFHKGGYGGAVTTSISSEIYNIFGPKRIENNKISFGNKQNILHTIFHEFGHSFVNPITTEYKNEINQSRELFTPIEDVMREMAYGQWMTCVNEHLIRVIVIRLQQKIDKNFNSDHYLEHEYNKGFIYINDLYNLMDSYENNREQYPAYKDFYPQIIHYFQDKCSESNK